MLKEVSGRKSLFLLLLQSCFPLSRAKPDRQWQAPPGQLADR